VFTDSTTLPAGATFLRLTVNAVDAVGRTSSGELLATLSPYSPPVPPTFESTLACTTPPPIPFYSTPTPVFFDATYSGTYEGYVQDIWTAYILDVFRNILEPVQVYPGNPTRVTVYIDSTKLPAGAAFLGTSMNAEDSVGRTSSAHLEVALTMPPATPPTTPAPIGSVRLTFLQQGEDYTGPLAPGVPRTGGSVGSTSYAGMYVMPGLRRSVPSWMQVSSESVWVTDRWTHFTSDPAQLPDAPLPGMPAPHCLDLHASMHNLYIRTSLTPEASMSSMEAGRGGGGRILAFSNVLSCISTTDTKPGDVISNTIPMWDHPARLQLTSLTHVRISLTNSRNELVDLNGCHWAAVLRLQFVMKNARKAPLTKAESRLISSVHERGATLKHRTQHQENLGTTVKPNQKKKKKKSKSKNGQRAVPRAAAVRVRSDSGTAPAVAVRDSQAAEIAAVQNRADTEEKANQMPN